MRSSYLTSEKTFRKRCFCGLKVSLVQLKLCRVPTPTGKMGEHFSQGIFNEVESQRILHIILEKLGGNLNLCD